MLSIMSSNSPIHWREKIQPWVHLSAMCCLLLIPYSTSVELTSNGTIELGYKPLDFKYHHYTEMTEYLKDIAKKYPDLTYMYSIGESFQKRELWTMVVSSKQGDDIPLGIPNVKFIGNIHGNEAVGRELILHMIEYLVTNYKINDTVTRLLDTTRFHFLPSMNPDGFEYARELSCTRGPGRGNARNMDLNRSFPDHFRKNSKPPQPETTALRKWMDRLPFVLSASLHGGALVANYPFENTPEDTPLATFSPSLSPDDDVFKHLAKVYAQAHPTMHQGIPCQPEGPVFKGGITNGAAWYPITGGMQDYNYVWHGCMEITLEISCCKYPSHRELNKLWRDNKEALLWFSEEAHQGIKGLITDYHTGQPIQGAKLRIVGRDMLFKSTSKGEFWRILLPRRDTYRIEVQADDYQKQVVPFHVTLSQEGANWVNITLKRLDDEINELVEKTKVVESSVEFNNEEKTYDETLSTTTPFPDDENINQTLNEFNKTMLEGTINPLNSNDYDKDNSSNFHIHADVRSEKSIQDAIVSAGHIYDLSRVTFFGAIISVMSVCW